MTINIRGPGKLGSIPETVEDAIFPIRSDAITFNGNADSRQRGRRVAAKRIKVAGGRVSYWVALVMPREQSALRKTRLHDAIE
jgi:hypothetical protein